MRSFSLALPCSKSIVHLTSPAVNGLPSCQFTPWRNGKVSSVPSSFQAQPVARSGTIDRRVFCGTRWSNMTRLLKTPIIGRLTASVDSSSIDMLAGLSKWPILRIPPDFCADAIHGDNSTSAPAAASTQRSRIIIRLLFMTPAFTTGDCPRRPFFGLVPSGNVTRLSYFPRPVHPPLVAQGGDDTSRAIWRLAPALDRPSPPVWGCTPLAHPEPAAAS